MPRTGLFSQLKHEVFGEAPRISAYLLVHASRGSPIEISQVGIEHDLVAPDQIDLLLDGLHWNNVLIIWFRRLGH